MGRKLMNKVRDSIYGEKLIMNFNYDTIREHSYVESWPGGFDYSSYNYRGRGSMTRTTTKKKIDFDIYSSTRIHKSKKGLSGFGKEKSLDENLESIWKKLKSQERKGGRISLP